MSHSCSEAIFSDLMLKMVIKGIEMQLEKLYDYSTGIDLSCNFLEGSIPAKMGILKGLSMLNLSHNGLYGEIPASIQNMNGLDSLDLSFNKLSGHIPQSIASLDSLGYLNCLIIILVAGSQEDLTLIR